MARPEESIRALKSRRNELSPISRLPVEILCKIFSLVEDNDNSTFYDKLDRSPESWTNFSHVSQHWRSSALNSPELWTKIPLNYPRWAQEMLTRSKMAKLTIRSSLSFDNSSPRTIETIRSCLYEMNRVEEINLIAIPGSILEQIFLDLPKSAPQLHTLCIGSPRFSATSFSILEDFLYDTEHLQCVELTNCKINWDSQLLNGLTRLTLEDSLMANCSFIQVLHALQRMPALTDLHLKNSIPHDSCGPSTYPVVDLPCLRILRISSGVGPLTTILRHITFPHLTTLSLTCRENRSTQIDFSEAAFLIYEDFLYGTEHLQCVELTNCNFSWDSRLLTGLTRLTLEDCSKANCSIIQVLHALQRMPALTDFHLKDSIPDDSDGPSIYPVVDLPCLRVLRMSSGVGPLTTVLRHITFPHSAKLNLTCNGNQSTQIDFSNFLSVLATTFLSSLVIRSLSLQLSLANVTQTPGLGFYLWTTAFDQDCFPPPSSLIYQPRLQLVLTWPSSQPYNHVKALTCAFDAMSLPFLTQLQISNLDCIDSMTWVKTFGKLPLLERVFVQSHSPELFFEALVYKPKAAEKSETAYHNVPLPELRHIHLEGTEFDPIDPSSTSIEMLLDYLMERFERKAEVQVLHLDDCYNLSSDDVERLKEVVDVIWDGLDQQIICHFGLFD